MQLARLAFSLARANTGNRMAANIEMIAMTTKSSINVNPLFLNFVCIINHLPKICAGTSRYVIYYATSSTELNPIIQSHRQHTGHFFCFLCSPGAYPYFW